MDAIGTLGGVSQTISQICRAVLALERRNRELLEQLRQREGLIDQVYEERARLVAFLAACYPASWGTDADAGDDWRVILIDTPQGQLSWHISYRDVALFEASRVAPDGHTWDGHTTVQKYLRLARLVAFTAKAPHAFLNDLETTPEALAESRARHPSNDATQILAAVPGREEEWFGGTDLRTGRD